MWENAHIFVVAKNRRKNRKNVYTMGACGACMILIAKNAPCVSHVSHVPCVFMSMVYEFVDCVVRQVNTPHGNVKIGGSLEGVHRRKMNGPSDDSAVINYSAEVPDQVQVKKQNEECNKRDATVLEKLKVSSVEDIILDETKTQILSIADYWEELEHDYLYYCFWVMTAVVAAVAVVVESLSLLMLLS